MRLVHGAGLLALLGNTWMAQADVRLPALFSNHAVLQKTARVPVWGWAAPGEEVQVSLGQAQGTAKANDAGKWSTTLDLSASGPGPFDLVVRGKNELKVSDVLVGEVWICAGQSNMEMKLSTTGAVAEIEKANNPQLRHFKVEKSASAAPAEDVKGQWVTATNPTAGDFTGVGYYFGKKLQEELKVPVGLINESWGGSLGEAWVSPEALAADAGIKARVDAIKAETKPDAMINKVPSALFQSMLAPIIPYAIKGVIWYQGESNAGSGLAAHYRKLLSVLVGDWRSRWQSGDFPFYVCQLANYQAYRTEPGLATPWAELREAQAQFPKDTPNAGTAILIDVGEEKTIHPSNKKDPGERLARIALARDYGREVVYSGPTLASATFADGKATIKMANTDGGLVAKPIPPTYQPLSAKPETMPRVRNSPDSQIEGFIICGADHKWAWADAKIQGDSIIVTSPKIPQPVAVRYGWENNPICNLYNGAGLPAGPFRTDDFALTKSPAQKAAPSP